MTRDHPPIFVLRHGETLWNTELRLQGTQNSPLTERGRQQAQAMGRALARALRDEAAEIRDAHFVTSPLGRTRETAALIGAAIGIADTDWQEDARLAELGYGEWEGRTIRDIDAISPGIMARWRAAPLEIHPPGGETHLELRARVGRYLEDALEIGRTLVIVGHGVAGAMLRGLYLGLSPTEIFVLEKPQDAFFRLHGGAATRIAVGESG